MIQAFRIETLDRSGRWYLTPGARSIYDLRVRNDSKNALDCLLVVEEPAAGVSVDPRAFSLRGHEVRTVTVTFSPDATAGRSNRVLISLRSDDDGAVLATFEHPLVFTGGTDCSVAVAWKDAIVEAGELRGFEVACSVHSQSETGSTFQVSLAPHPALSFPQIPPIALEPGQLGEMVIPIHWNRDAKDESGWNHPLMIEVAVPVSNGRRTSRIRWEAIELNLEPFLRGKTAPTMSVAVSSRSHAASESTSAATPPPATTLPPAPMAPAAAAASAAPTIAAAPSVRPAVTSTTVPASTAAAPMLMLNGLAQLLMLAAPASALPASKESGAAVGGGAKSPQAAPVAAAALSPVVELPLFPAMVAPSMPPTAPPAPKRQDVSQKPAAASAPTPAVSTPVAPAASPKAAPAISWTIKQAPPGEPQPKPASPAVAAAAAAAASAPSTAPAPAAAQSSPPAPASTERAPKLTPYTAAKWDALSEDNITVPRVAAKPAEVVASPAAESSTSSTSAVRVQPAVKPRPTGRPVPAGLLIGGLAAVALVVAGVFFFKPNAPAPAPTANAVAGTPLVLSGAPAPQWSTKVAGHKPAATHRAAKPKVVALAPTPQAVVTPAPATPKPATPRPSTPAASARSSSQRAVGARPTPAPTHISRYGTLYQPESGPVVALGTVEAYYGPRGHAVRVMWGSAEQASAIVQLVDQHGTTVSQTFVRGVRSSALLYLPRAFRGPLTVQVTSIGRLGERVATTTSLPAFGQ